MGKKRLSTELVPAEIDDAAYGAVLADVTDLLESARHAAARSVNAIMTATYHGTPAVNSRSMAGRSRRQARRSWRRGF